MNKEQLEQHRAAALDLFYAVKNGYQGELSTDLLTLYRNIKENKFLLAVMGEVKAGKSTFINALLGEELLPSDARQSTSAIIEVFKADKKFIKATFANGIVKEVQDNLSTPDSDDTVKFLKKIASVQDEHRDLPVVQLNDFIIEHYDSKKNESVYTENDLDKWIKNSELENIHKIETEDFNRLIKEYIHENKDGSTIPTKIEVGYPHEFEFDQFRLVDTPGIGAIGGIEEKTKRFVEKVDATIYIHRGAPSARSLQHAWNNEITKKAKKHMFLVLSHRGSDTEDNNVAKLEETIKTFSQIRRDRIFSVDSLIELALNEFYPLVDWDSIKVFRKNNKQIRKVTASAWEDAEGDVGELFDLLEKESNMKKLKKQLIEFSENAVGIQLSNFVEEIAEHFEVVISEKNPKLKSLKNKFKNPQTFSKKVADEKNKIESYKANMRGFSRKIKRTYDVSDAQSIMFSKFSDIFEIFKAELEGKTFSASDSSGVVDKAIETLNSDYFDNLEKFIENLKTSINKTIENFNAEQTDLSSIDVPQIVMSNIWESAKIDALEDNTRREDSDGFWNKIGRWIPFTDIGTHEVSYKTFNITTYWNSIKKRVITDVDSNKSKITESINNLLEESINSYDAQIIKKLEDRKLFLLDLADNEYNNEKIQGDIKSLSHDISKLENNHSECQKILGEL